MRSSIALTAARGIEYIHSISPKAVHGHITSSTFLLASLEEACVSDIGLMSPKSPLANRFRVYRAPEVTRDKNMSQMADVYSFGVVLLELFMGTSPRVQSIVRVGWSSKALDRELWRYAVAEEDMVHMVHMMQMLRLAIDCVQLSPYVRPSMSMVVTRIGEIQRASLWAQELLAAPAELIGSGTHGMVFKKKLKNGKVVAVKCFRKTSLPEWDFRERMDAIAAMKHPNLVALQKYNYIDYQRLLVYDYMPFGSLFSLLHGNRGSGRASLDWKTRSSIALTAAQGIEYIHSISPSNAHGNIKSSKILLAKPGEACVSDHGLTYLTGPLTTRALARGYLAPEVTDIVKISQKADAYSFGVLLLELLTGKSTEETDLVSWVQSVIPEEWSSDLLDIGLTEELLRYPLVEEEMVQMLELAMDCVEQVPDKRPLMSMVVHRIEEIQRASLSAVEMLTAPSVLLGTGTYGTVYKAQLKKGDVVALKKLRELSSPRREFRERIEAASKMEHRNLVPLRAYYYSKKEKLLVYDYMPMGSLYTLLHGDQGAKHVALDWKTRASIALTAAQGIEYIHSTSLGAAHGNIKSSNILLIGPDEACVSDYGIAHLVGPFPTLVQASVNHAPEDIDAQNISRKTDVYRFGVMLLELLTRKSPAEEGADLLRWVQSIPREKWSLDMLDVELFKDYAAENDIVHMLQLAMDCVERIPEQRPSMSVVVLRIKEIQQATLWALDQEWYDKQKHRHWRS